jgi:iron complex transport system permease protein
MMGVAASSLLSGVTSLLVLSGDSQGTQNVMYWLLGSFAGAQWRLVGVSAVCVGVAGLATLVLARKLNLMALGDESAAALGIRPGKVRVGMFALCALMTGATVAVAGSIGFIGLVMPNLARLLVGDDYRRIVPVSMLLGALVLLWADTVARSVLAPGEIPIGVLTAFIGVPVLVVALRSRQGGLR